MPENTGALQESSKFKKGQSGNPQGKPKGARNKSTLAAEALLEGSLEKICKRVEVEDKFPPKHSALVQLAIASPA